MRIPLWLTGTIIGRDVVILIGLAVIHVIAGKVTVRPRMAGKIATVLQMSVVLWTLFQWPRGALIYWTISAAVFTALSGIHYIYDGVRQLNAHPASAPTPKQP